MSACDFVTNLICDLMWPLCFVFFSVCRLHGNRDLMHGSCMTAVGLVAGRRTHSCSHGSDHAREWQWPRYSNQPFCSLIQLYVVPFCEFVFSICL